MIEVMFGIFLGTSALVLLSLAAAMAFLIFREFKEPRR